MSLQTTLQYMTRRAFRSLNGTLLSGTWVHRAMPVYDASTGTVVAPAPALYPVDVLVSMYRKDEIDGVRILASDRRLCVFQALPTDGPAPVPVGLSVVPTVRDQVEIGGTLWHIMSVEQDGASLTYQCQGRAEGEA